MIYKKMAWRSWDRPMVGTIFRLPDDKYLQRGITFTIMPDGRPLQVPAMSRLQVRAESQSHEETNDKGMMQALQDLLKGRKPTQGRARHNRRGRVHVVGQPFDLGGNADPYVLDPHGAPRPVEGLQGAGAHPIVAEI